MHELLSTFDGQDPSVDVVRSAPSSRALSELQRLRVRLASWRRDAEVSDLTDPVRSLLQPLG